MDVGSLSLRLSGRVLCVFFVVVVFVFVVVFDSVLDGVLRVGGIGGL